MINPKARTLQEEVFLERQKFLRQIAHEIRTPLAGLLLQAELTEMMLKRESNAAFISQDLEKIKTQVTEISALFDHLVDHFSQDEWRMEQSST